MSPILKSSIARRLSKLCWLAFALTLPFVCHPTTVAAEPAPVATDIEIDIAHASDADDLSVSADTEVMASASGPEVKFWDTKAADPANSLIRTIVLPHPVASVHMVARNRAIIVSGDIIYLYDLNLRRSSC